MTFVPPTWFEGALIWASYLVIPVIIGIIALIYTWFLKEKHEGIGLIICIACLVLAMFGSQVLWHE